MTISVLLVDDEIYILEQAKSHLNSQEFYIETSISAVDALHERDLSVYDAIVSDYQMPEMDGITFLKEVRSRYGDIPFILFTGKGREQIVIEAINNGADSYLQKGDDPQSQFAELAHKIRRAVNRKKTGDALRESEERFRRLSEDLPVCVCSFLPDSTVTYVNPALAAMAGMTPEELIGRPFFELAARSESEDIRKKLGVLTPENPNETHEQSNIDSDGMKRYMEWRNRAFFDNNGNVVRFLAVGIDITARKMAEMALRDNEKRLRRFYESGLFGVLFWNVDGRITEANDKFLEMTGYSREDLRAGLLNGYSLTPPEFVYIDEQSMAELMATGVNKRAFEKEYIRKDGTRISVILAGAMLDEQRVNGVAFVLDNSERKKAEEALLKSEANLQLALSGSETGMWEMNIPTMTGVIDERAAGILGYQHQDIGPYIADWDTLSHPDDLPLIHKRMADYLEGRTSIFESEHRMRHSSGEWRWVVGRGKITAWSKEGAPLRISGTLHDFTERRKTEDSLLKVNQKLNVFSHLTRKDLNNQMVVLNSYLDLLKDQQGEEVPRGSPLEGIETAVRQIQKIIEYTKDYQDMGVKPPMWQNLKNTMLLGLSHIPIGTVQHSLETGDLEVFADPLLEKVCQRLFENTYLHGGHATVIRVWHTITPSGLTIFFEDDGTGIPQVKKEKIFIRSEAGQGSRNSLIFVKEILDITGISIRETGELGKGARFEIAVPKGMYRSSTSSTTEDSS